MSVTFSEKFKSRHTLVGNNPSVELVYNAVVSGEANEDLAIKTAALATLPDTYDGKPRQSIEIDELMPDLWQVTIVFAYTFSKFVLPSNGAASSFDTTGATTRRLQSLSTVGRYGVSDTDPVPDYQGAIGVSENGVEGVEIVSRQYTFRETRIVDDSDVDAAFKAVIYNLTRKVNGDTFLGFAAGEVLFLGAVGNQRSETEWEIVYFFAAEPNKTDLTVGQIAGIAKKGWEYLWVLYRDEVDDVASALVKVPAAVYVEQVYEPGDFSALGL